MITDEPDVAISAPASASTTDRRRRLLVRHRCPRPIDELLGEPAPEDVDADVEPVADEDEARTRPGSKATVQRPGDLDSGRPVEGSIAGETRRPKTWKPRPTISRVRRHGDAWKTYPRRGHLSSRTRPYGNAGSELGSPEDHRRGSRSCRTSRGRRRPRTVVVGSEGFSGPSWQEPAASRSAAISSAREPRRGERDVPAAFLTGVLLAGVALRRLCSVGGVRDRRRHGRPDRRRASSSASR